MRHFPATRFASGAASASGPRPGASGDPRTPAEDEPDAERASWPRALTLIVAGGIVLIAATVLATGALVLHARNHELADSERELSNTTLILAEQIDRTYEAIELVQKSLIERMRSLGIETVEGYRQRMSGYDVHLMLRDKISGLRPVDAVILVDARGELINFSRRWPLPSVSVVDRDYFKILASDPQLESLIGEPVFNRNSGVWTTSLVRKFSSTDGRFLGLIMGVMEVKYLEEYFGSIALGPGSSISLLRDDGTLLARYPRLAEGVGKIYPGGVEALKDRTSVVIRTLSSMTGTDRLLAYRRLSKFPLFVSAGTDVDTILARWENQSLLLLGTGVLRALVICLIGFIAAREIVRGIKRSKERLQEQKRKLDAALNHMSQGLCMLDASARLVLCNNRYLEMYRLSARDIRPGCTIYQMLEQRQAAGTFAGDPQQYCADVLAAIAGGHAARHVFELEDGRIIEIVNRPIAGGGWIATHNDVTQQRRAEREIEAARVKAECAEREARAAHTRLLEAIEVVPEGLALFDAEDRFVLWNRRYLEHYPKSGDCVAVGVRFEDVLRTALARGQHPEAEGREEAWLAERLARHAAANSTYEQPMRGDRWLRVEERRTADGGSIGIRIDITDLKQREASFRLLFESNPLPMCVYDAETLRFLAVNDAALAHYGHDRERFLAMTALDIRPAEDRDDFDAARRELGEYAATENCRHLKSDGTTLNVDVYSRKMRYEGRPARIAAVVDTTERRRAERERDRNREFLDMIIEHVPSMIAVKDIPDFRYILINRAGEREFGFPRRDLLGHTAQDVLAAPIAQRLTELDLQALAAGPSPLVTDYEFELPNGSRRTGIAKRLVIRDEHGGPQYLLVVVEDLTDRRRLEEDRNRHREFLHGIIENVPMTIFVRDARERRYVLVNRAAEIMWGIPRAEILGKRPRDLFPKETTDQIAGYDDVLLNSDTRLLVEEHELLTPNNGRRLVKAKRIGIRNEQGEQYLVGVLEDVTESRAVEQQLRQSQKMEAVGNLTGGLAHDFNNLLTVMIGNLDLLQADVEGQRAAEQKVAAILQAAERGADLTHQLLAFSRRQRLSPRRIDVNELIGNTTRLLARTLGENVTVDVRLADDLWPVTADAGQLEAALVNIAINARDAMPGGGVLTVVSEKAHLGGDYVALHPEATAGDYVKIELRDTGIGMPPDVLARIFEPFFTTKPPGKGTGLGLSMVYGFMQQSGGHLSADSRVGEGTTFRLYLPRAVETPARPMVMERPPPAPAPSGKVILAVDDNPAVRATVLLQLRALGYCVHEADSAQAALKLLDELGKVDLLFTDIVMPGPMNGRELAAKARLKRPGLKVLYTSGYPGAFEGDDDGAALLNKPYRKRDLANAIDRALNGQG
jgi:PAS domain S-box-containing protein